MLDLPSTTEVFQRIPKEAFYQHLKLDNKTRQQFVSGVKRIAVVNVIRVGTANLSDGERVHEILVLEIVPKKEVVPKEVLLAIASANSNPMVLVDAGSGLVSTKIKGRIVSTNELSSLKLQGANLDEAWNSFVSQVVFQEENGVEIEKRLAKKIQIEILEHEIEILDKKSRKERQLTRKNELFYQLKNKNEELLRLKEDN
jgi:hypothetical protein